jgi:putative hydrolase of HD superfamily
MIPRSGWVSNDVAIQDVESVAEHSFSTTVLALLLSDLELEQGRKVDVSRVLRMALLHDLSETLTFDISKGYLEYLGKRGKQIKDEVEAAAWKHILQGLAEPKLRSTYASTQEEFDAEQSLESRIVHAADRLDIMLQVAEYTKRGYPRRLLASLWNSSDKELSGSRIESVRTLRKVIRSLAKSVDSG